MKIKCITCDALVRPFYYCASIAKNIVDIELVKRGLHNHPDNLRSQLQSIIDRTGSEYDAICMGYGLCGQSIAGLKAPTIPLVIPRAHDCITLFLGSRARYQDQFENYPGTYWYAHDYIEREDGSGGALSLGAETLGTNLEAEYQRYVEKFGQENADYIMTVMGAWQKYYQRSVFIDMKIGDSSQVRAKAMSQADERGWEYAEIPGHLTLIQKLLDGAWLDNQDQDFLVVQPGQSIRMTYSEDIICAEYSTVV